MRCDCCNGTFVDEVGLMAIEDAIVTYRAELRAKHRRDESAWAAARARVDAAVREVTG